MKTLISIQMQVDQDGEDYHVRDDTQTHGNSWAEVYKGLVMLRDELNRQIESRKLCPFNPMNVRQNGFPQFDPTTD